MKLFKPALLAVSLFAAQGVSADHHDTTPSPHGGQVQMTDSYHLELVVKDKEVNVYVLSHANTPMPSAGMAGTATILSGETKVEVKLEAAEESLLKGTGDFKTSDDMKVLVSVTPAPQTARFTPFQKAEATPATPEDAAKK